MSSSEVKMLNKIQNKAISKPFFISLILVCLVFTSMSVNGEQVYAACVNQSDEIELGIDVEDKLENSHENQILQAKSYSLKGGTFKDIQDTINKASDGDTITLEGKFISNGNDTMLLSKRLIFTSSSKATLDGKQMTRIFEVLQGGANSQFKNLKFINGYSKSSGGAVYIKAKYITFDGCSFENNRAGKTSGAIQTYYDASTAQGLTIKNCNFIKNNAVVAAGAVGAFSHQFLIENCIFDSNYVVGENDSYGGAIQIGLDTAVSYGVVRSCVFKNNKAVSLNGLSHAGAACVRNGSSYYNCIFINNSADQGGALTYHASGNLYNCTLINNTANEFGGAVSIMRDYLDNMNLNITKSIFKSNSAPLGGAVKLDGFNIMIEDSIFEDNYASQYGGGVNINAANVKVIDSQFNGNNASINGGALFIKGMDVVISNSDFIKNNALPDASKLNDGLGGAIYVNSTKVLASNNNFKLNTARNGSAIYFDSNGIEFKLVNNTLYQNQAWVYKLLIFAHDIYYGEVENFKSIIYGGNNIADFDNLNVSNAIYNAASNDKIEIDGEYPVFGATDSGKLYQDDREYDIDVLMTIQYEDGTVVYNNTLKSNYLGEVYDSLENLKPGRYYVTAKHFEDNYYKAITNATVFNVIPKTDNKLSKQSNDDTIDYGDFVIWTLNITNNGPNDATGVIVNDVLPEGLIWISDDTNGAYNPQTGILTIGSLKVGETLIVNIITKVNATGEIVNKANVTGNEFDIDLDNNHDEKEIIVPKTVDLSVIKNVNVSNPKFGDLVEWNLIVSNHGPDVAHDVKVADILPDSLIWISDDSCGMYDSKTGIWNIGDMKNHERVELNIITRVNGTGSITNIANVTCLEKDINPANNIANKTILINKSGDLAIVKTVNATEVNYGDLIKWTITISNKGPDKVSAAYVQDILPNGLILVNYTASKGFYDEGIWAFCCLENKETQTLELICKVNTTGTITNIAEIYGNTYDPNPDNNIDNETIRVNSTSDISVLKQVSDKNPYFGDMIIWTIKVTNNGPDRATNIKVYDILPNGLIFYGCVSTRGVYENGIWSIDYLNAGESEVLNISCFVNELGIIVNDVYAIADEFDTNMSNNYDNESINALPVSDISIVKITNVSTANYKDLIKWTLVVSNNGFNNATGVIVEDILPDSLEIVSTSGDYINGIWYIGDLNVGESKTLEIVTRIIKTGIITNTAIAYGDQKDPDWSNNDDNATVHVNPAADLSITKTVSKYTYKLGEIVSYNIKISNNGPSDAFNVKVFEEFPQSLSLKSFSVSDGTFNTSTNVWSLNKLASGEKEQLHIEFRAIHEGIFKNVASIVSDTPDSNEDNNRDDAIVKIISNDSSKIVKKIANKLSKKTIEVKNIKQSVNGLQKNPTANVISLLIVSALFSMIFSGCGIFKKR